MASMSSVVAFGNRLRACGGLCSEHAINMISTVCTYESRCFS